MQIKINTTHLTIMNSFRMEERRGRKMEVKIYPKIENKGRRKNEHRRQKSKTEEPSANLSELINIS